MRDRKRDKGVKVCPEVKMSEVAFLEPIEENAGSDNDNKNDEEQIEGSSDPKIQ